MEKPPAESQQISFSPHPSLDIKVLDKAAIWVPYCSAYTSVILNLA